MSHSSVAQIGVGADCGPSRSPWAALRSASPLLLLVAVVGGCRSIGATTLERRDVQAFTVETLETAGQRFVRASGLAMHGALTVQRIETQTEEGTVRLRVLMSLTKKGESGSFSVIVHVPAGIRRVEFGDERAVIWPAGGAQ